MNCERRAADRADAQAAMAMFRSSSLTRTAEATERRSSREAGSMIRQSLLRVYRVLSHRAHHGLMGPSVDALWLHTPYSGGSPGGRYRLQRRPGAGAVLIHGHGNVYARVCDSSPASFSAPPDSARRSR
eukprot:701226-Pleurochrysis_carterae.AAC.2